MRSIEIKTSHNIVLIFELATLMQRILAAGIDLFIISTVSSLISGVVYSNQVAIYVFVMPIIMFYNLGFEVFNNGQTPGKMALKIRVISLDGESTSLRSSIIRWAFRLIDILASTGLVAILSIFSSEKSQRIGDILANTTVISLSSSSYNSIKSLSKLDNLDYEVTYPKVAMYNDKDMMLVKDALKRFKKSDNEANRKFCILLAKRIRKDLDIPKQSIGTSEFLNKILNDYIMLTR